MVLDTRGLSVPAIDQIHVLVNPDQSSIPYKARARAGHGKRPLSCIDNVGITILYEYDTYPHCGLTIDLQHRLI